MDPAETIKQMQVMLSQIREATMEPLEKIQNDWAYYTSGSEYSKIQQYLKTVMSTGKHSWKMQVLNIFGIQVIATPIVPPGRIFLMERLEYDKLEANTDTGPKS